MNLAHYGTLTVAKRWRYSWALYDQVFHMGGAIVIAGDARADFS
jgi:hypothetical protein